LSLGQAEEGRAKYPIAAEGNKERDKKKSKGRAGFFEKEKKKTGKKKEEEVSYESKERA